MSTRVLTTSSWTGNTGVATINASVTIQGVSGPPFVFNLPTEQINYSCFKHEVVNLASGLNTINAPVATAVIKVSALFICPPEGNTTQIEVGTATDGSNGHQIHPQGWSKLGWDLIDSTPPETLTIYTAGTINGVILLWV